LAQALLRAWPRLQILATSREALGSPGAVAWRVPSLTLPTSGAPLTVATAAPCEAITLVVARATTVQPGCSPREREMRPVVEICRQLEGIPLAIELAAARLSALALDQLAARLADRIQLLTGGSRTALPRQQTLRATIDPACLAAPSAATRSEAKGLVGGRAGGATAGVMAVSAPFFHA
jgi:predicted ATPase